MAQLKGRGQGPAFLVSFGEADVRHLFGAAAFGRGDAFQRAGHVREPLVYLDAVTAEVLGEWHRKDAVTILHVNGRIQSHCTCAEPVCRHAAATLLQWIREPSTFTVPIHDDSDDDFENVDEIDGTSDDTESVHEFAALFEMYGVSQLRELARARGVRVTGRTKVEIIQQLAAALTEPEALQAAVQNLNPDERIVLEALDLLSVTDYMTPRSISTACRGLGGRGGQGVEFPPDIESLVEKGLVFRAASAKTPMSSYIIPRTVLLKLPSRDGIIARVDAKRARGYRRMPREMSMLETVLVIAHELRSGTFRSIRAMARRDDLMSLPPGWLIDEKDPRNTQGQAGPWWIERDVSVVPLTSPGDPEGVRRLSDRTGKSTDAIAFALTLMGTLGLVEDVEKDRDLYINLREELVSEFMGLEMNPRLNRMLRAWLSGAGALDLRRIASAKGPLQLHIHQTRAVRAIGPHSADVRRLVTRLIGRLPLRDGGVYDVSSLLDLLRNIAPTLLHRDVSRSIKMTWWLTERKHQTTLNLDQRADWERVWRPLVVDMLNGPLTWLGLVDVYTDKTETVAFQVRPEAAVIVGREIGDSVTTGGPPLTLTMDHKEGVPVVVVPPGHRNESSHSVLMMVGEMVRASREGIQYRLRPARLQAAFDVGVDGEVLIERLETQAGGTIPDEVRATLERWWNEYGTLRLYDDLTLIELGDDVLLREILATTSLKEHVIHTFSPRLIAVDPAYVDTLLTQLTRTGHTPRVVEHS